MAKDRDNNHEELKGKVITGNFKSDFDNQTKKPVSNNQTNPMYKKLFKLAHTELTKHNNDYKSFSKFKPEDLR